MSHKRRRSHTVTVVCFALLTTITLTSLRYDFRNSTLDNHGLMATTATLGEPDSAKHTKVIENYGRLPITFEANHGQAESGIKFLSRSSSYTLLFTPTEATLSFLDSRANIKVDSPGKHVQIGMKMINASPESNLVAVDQLPGNSNYFLGNERRKWLVGIPTYEKIKYADIYSGIDLVFYGNQQQLEYDFHLAPGADVHTIKFRMTGVDDVQVDEQGDLLVRNDATVIRHHKPLAYQSIDGTRVSVNCSYKVTRDHEVSFETGEYDSTRPLTIDPVLSFSTYLGGGNDDRAYRIAVDAFGDAYILGQTRSTNLPTSDPNVTFSGDTDAFVAKINSSGTALLFCTYIGGDAEDGANALDLDEFGNAYVTGRTKSTNFPTVNPLQPFFAGGDYDAYVTKLSSTGSLIYSTYLGGTGTEDSFGLKVDGSQNIYVGGQTLSTDYPTTSGSFQTTNHGSADIYVTKIRAAGTTIEYSTLVGGVGRDMDGRLAIDNLGNAYVTGQTDSPDFPIVNAFQSSKANDLDAFVFKLNSTGTALVYSTYFGGNIDDQGADIAVDGAGRAYVTGNTTSPDFPLINALRSTQQTVGGSLDGFVIKFDPEGTPLYSTYIPDSLYGIAIAADCAGNAYVLGETGSGRFPQISPIQGVCDLCSGLDIFVLKLNGTGSSISFSTQIGTSSDDFAGGIAVSNNGEIYISGSTSSPDFPLVNAFQPQSNGTFDAVILKIEDVPPSITCPNNIFVFAAAGESGAVVNYSVDTGIACAVTSGLEIVSSPASGSVFPIGTTTVTSTATDQSGNTSSCSFNVTVGNTQTGNNVSVQSGITTLTFTNVLSPGASTVVAIDPSTVGLIPGGFAVSETLAFQIASTATFTGPITLAFVVPNTITEADFNDLIILHNENGTLVDVTASSPPRDFSTRTIYAITNSLSPFYLVRRSPYISPLFDQTKAYKSGSTIPIKLQLRSSTGTNISSAATVVNARGLLLVGGNSSNAVIDSGNANPDSNFRYDPALGGPGGGYIFNLSTKGLDRGTYLLSFYAGPDHSFFYTVKFEVK